MDTNSTINSSYAFPQCFTHGQIGMIESYVIMLLCFSLGTPAHSWFLWLSLRDGWKTKPTQVFSLNHTVLELVFCIQYAVELLSVLFSDNDILWRMIYFIFSLSWIGRPLMQMCICIEQYLAVLHPIMFLKYKGVQYRITSAAVVWLMAAAYGSFEAVSLYTKPDPIFETVSFIAVTVISFCCVSVLRALKHPGPGDTQITKKRGRHVGNQQKRKAFNIIFSGLLIVLFTYIPGVSLIVLKIIKIDQELLECDIVPFMTSFNMLGVMITPLLKIYKGVHLKCFSCQRKMKENS